MLFNSIDFAIFLPIVFIIYWFVTNKSLKLQNALLFVASYFFYACWDWRFLFLLLFSTLLSFYTGLRIQKVKEQKSKRFWFWLSITINLGLLIVFKYYNFFAESFVDALLNMGLKVDPWTLGIILPLGISFYTFHGLSYVIDIYKERIEAESNFVNYAVFVSFFPLLVAGPIERATHLLPQIKKARTFDYSKAVDGLRQILWGLFKKIVIADNCAKYANEVFNNYPDHSGSTLFLGAIFFSIQIYGDFSGYSDIAIGTARLFGIDLLRNFAFPYFSRNIAEFWRRWHISLSTWFRDYLYIPLGGNKVPKWKRIINTFIIFTLIGLWHGANTTFIVYGVLNAVYFVPLILLNKKNYTQIVSKGDLFPSLKDLFSIIFTFLLITITRVFFRAENVSDAFNILSNIFSKTLFTIPKLSNMLDVLLTIMLVILFTAIEWIWREQQYAIENIGVVRSKYLRWSIYMLILSVIYFFGNFGATFDFIYFQF